MERETLISLRPKSTQERFIWEAQKNKQLLKKLQESEKETEELRKEIISLKKAFRKDDKGALIISNRKNKEKIKVLTSENNKLKILRDQLIHNNTRLQLLNRKYVKQLKNRVWDI